MDPLAWAGARLSAFVRDLEVLVRLESPSRDLEGLSRCASFLKEAFSPLGRVEERLLATGPLLRFSRPGREGRLLLLLHYDTVHPKGAFSFRIEGDVAVGPGVYDMKGSFIQLLYALRFLEEQGVAHPSLTALFTPDEEIGSLESRPFIEEEARRADWVLVLEPPTPEGDLKVARKGVGLYRLRALGRAAHQGVEPEKGVNAIFELAHQVLKVAELEDRKRGTTLGPNRIQGGTATNVVAEEAVLEIDLRTWSLEEVHRVEAGLRALKPVLEGARLEVSGGLNRPPMEPTPASLALFEKAQAIGRRLGLDLRPARVGGGSDGNFTAPIAPTLDGLGLFGRDAHQKTEGVYLREVPRRLALLALLLSEL